MAKKFDAHGAAARAWSFALLGAAFTLFVVSALLLWSPYDHRQADLREPPGASERETVAGQDIASSSARPRPGERLPDASPGAIRETLRDGVVELDVQPVSGQLRAPDVDEPSSDDPVYRQAPRDAGSGGGGGGGTGGGSGADAGANGAAAGAESALPMSPVAGVAGAGDEAEASAFAPPEFYQFDPCGMVDCPYGTVCCNPSCGLCAPPGDACSRLTCSMPLFPISVSCGRNTCNAGEVCCNMSCGICTRPGESCSQRVCD